MKKKLIVATRPSLLAYTQTLQTIELLKKKNPDCDFEIVKISTKGDKVQDKPLTSFGGTGVFVKEIENALIEGVADFAVHSLKDIPSIQPDNLILASFTKREDPRDIILTKNNINYCDLHSSCIIGTGSPRRILQIKLLLKNAVFKDLRGNIDTRLAKLETNEYDAIVLAAAGIKRLGKKINENSFLKTNICIPAVGQGAIALECRKDDVETINILRSVNDIETEIAITAERSFMKTIGGGCKFPLAAYCIVNDLFIEMETIVGDQNTLKFIKLKGKEIKENAKILGENMANETILKTKEIGLIL